MRFMLPFLTVCILVISASSVLAEGPPTSIEPSYRENAASVLLSALPMKLILLESICSQSGQKGDMTSF